MAVGLDAAGALLVAEADLWVVLNAEADLRMVGKQIYVPAGREWRSLTRLACSTILHCCVACEVASALQIFFFFSFPITSPGPPHPFTPLMKLSTTYVATIQASNALLGIVAEETLRPICLWSMALIKLESL